MSKSSLKERDEVAHYTTIGLAMGLPWRLARWAREDVDKIKAEQEGEK